MEEIRTEVPVVVLPEEPQPSEDRPPALASGSRVDHFKVVRLLGRGGMGEVYLARDTLLERKVALKVINPRFIGSDDAVVRFIIEARTTARFSHPHIVTIYAVGKYQESPYVALEYLEGQTLRQRIDEGFLSQTEVLRIGLAIAEALAEAHRHGILHRDLKPENVILPTDGRLRVVDFGLAKVLQASPLTLAAQTSLADPLPGLLSPPEPSRSHLLPDGFELLQAASSRGARGTPAYMAPEQWQAQGATKASDIWALGLLLYEMISGRHPYGDQATYSTALQVCSPDPVPGLATLRELRPALREILASCLQKEFSARPTAEQVVDALESMGVPRSHRLVDEECPYRGLLAYGERHGELFFGRDNEVDHLLERLPGEPILILIGPAGSGKTSLLQAGLVPRLRAQGPWEIIHFRPGSTPFLALARHLLAADLLGPFGLASLRLSSSSPEEPPGHAPPSADPTDELRAAQLLESAPSFLMQQVSQFAAQRHQQVLLSADQLEELYQEEVDIEQRRTFLQALFPAVGQAGGPIRVILSVREDCLEQLLADLGASGLPELAPPLVLRPPDENALGEVLNQPLRSLGYRFDHPDLVTEIVTSLHKETACLSLLQWTARMLWDRRDRSRRVLPSSAYAAIGGVTGALAEHAEEVVHSLSPPAQQLARALLLRLATPQGHRQPRPRVQLLEGLEPAAGRVLALLNETRLVCFRKARSAEAGAIDSTEVELVHEPLLHSWERLRSWLEEDRADLVYLDELKATAQLWEKQGRRPEQVWHGLVLQEVQQRIQQLALPMPRLVTEFLAAGEVKEQHQRKRRQFWRMAIGITLAALVVAALAIGQSLMQKQEAAHQQQVREIQKRALEHREGAWSAARRGEALEARARLRSSLELQDSVLARALWRSLRVQELIWRVEVGGSLSDLAVTRDGSRIATASRDGSVIVLHHDTAQRLIRRRHEGGARVVAFSDVDHLLASGDRRGSIRLWDCEAGEQPPVTLNQPIGVTDLAFSPDGRMLGAASLDGGVRLWEMASREVRGILSGHLGEVLAISFSLDGKSIATAGLDHTVRLWSPRGELSQTLIGHGEAVTAVQFSPDGFVLASASLDRTVRVWNGRTGSAIAVLIGAEGPIRSVAFSPDGKWIAAGGDEEVIRLWETATARLLRTVTSPIGQVSKLEFTPDNELVVAGPEGVLALLKLLPRAPPPWVGTPGGKVRAVVFVPDGTHLISIGPGPLLQYWEVATGKRLRFSRPLIGELLCLEVSPAGEWLATGSRDGLVRLWNPATLEPDRILAGHTGAVTQVAFSPDGVFLASASEDQTIRLWSTGNGDQLQLLRNGAGVVATALRFSSNGRLLATASPDEQQVRFWDVLTGEEHHRLDQLPGVLSFDISPDGRQLAVSGKDRTTRLLELAHPERQTTRIWPADLGSLHYHPAGQWLGMASADGLAWIWDGRRSPVLLAGHAADLAINDLRFSPDGRLLATASDDGTLRVWRVPDQPSGPIRPAWWAPALLATDPPELITASPAVVLPLSDPADRPRPSPTAPPAPWKSALSRTGMQHAEDPDHGRQCWVDWDGTLQMWEADGTAAVQEKQGAAGQLAVALPQGCSFLTRTGEVLLATGSTPMKRLVEGASALTWDGSVLLASVGDRIRVFDEEGTLRDSFPAERGVTAIRSVGEEGWLALGFDDGAISLIPRRPNSPPPIHSLTEPLASRVVALLAGPPGLLLAGHANGTLGLWELTTGRRLETWQLHGAVVHLLLRGTTLFAATELGDQLTLDLTLYGLSWCEVLQEIWRSVPLVWDSGPARRAIPRNHQCAWSAEKGEPR